MALLTRRTTFASLGAALMAGGTVAAATLLRKPPSPVIATPVADAAPHLETISAMVAAASPAPPADVSVIDERGIAHRLAEFTGKGLVVNLWATWCVPCVAELPALAEFARKVDADGIMVLPLSSDRGGADVVRRFYGAHGLTSLPIWLDPKGEVSRAWGARGIPTTLIIDRQGRERGRVEGPVDWASDATISRLKQLMG